MSVNIPVISEKTFNILKGFGFGVDSFSADGKQVIDPTDATRFVVSEPNILVRLDSATSTLVLNTSEDLSEHKVRTMLKDLAQDYLMKFDYKIFGKKIKAVGEKQDIAKQAERDMADIKEGFDTMSGSSKTSYQSLDNVKIVVKHKKAVNEEVRGSRSRNIHSIFIQRGDERFKLPENNLAMARAMARHVQKGGEVFDENATSIIEMAQDLKKLREFVNYVRTAKIMNEDNAEYVQLAVENIENIKNTFKKLSGAKTYESTIENLTTTSIELSEDDDADLRDKFTVSHFDDKVGNVLGQLKSLSLKKTAFESYITKAVANESFANLKDLLKENDLVDFATPEARLGHQVNQLSFSANDTKLSEYLQNVSKKITSGGQLSQFEYGTIKSCLLGANTNTPTVESKDLGDEYENFLEQYDIL
jgi:molybdopterin converting factor small subunit